MDREALRRRLMATFLGELEEHVQALNRDLLALEKDAGSGRAELLVSLFRTAHSLKGAARSVGVEAIETTCHRLENLLGAARDGRRPLDAEAIELVYATADALKDAEARLREQQDPAGGRLRSVLSAMDSGARTPQTLSPIPAHETAATTSVLQATATQAAATPVTREGLVRVPAEKLDALLAGSGELLVARGRVLAARDDIRRLHDELRQWRTEWLWTDKHLRRVLASHTRLFPKRARLALEGTSERLKKLDRQVDLLSSRMGSEFRALERAAATLDDDIHRVSLFPFSHACEGLERTVRDLARVAGKQVELVIEGGDIEVDRLVLEGLKDPLLHLVRNAVDHGIETPDERQSGGKSAEGRVTVAAALRSGAVEIVVADNGRGLDVGAIRAEARRKKMPAPDNERDAAGLVFLPGFSTVRLVTELSGRGMGLDVVKHEVESLHGQVDISFERGHGTRVVLTVPLTVTTIRALLLGAAGQTFALPVTHVQRLIRVAAADLGLVGGREVLLSAGAPIPVVSLTDVLGVQSAAATHRPGHRAPLVVMGSGNTQAALAVDELIAEEEILVKSLGTRLRRVRHFAGATILPSGRVALILNTADVLSSAMGRAPSASLAATLAKQRSEKTWRLLLAEDSVTTRSLEKSILEAAGYEVVAVADGSDAWRILHERGADLVVADVEMPRMDGFALCDAIRRSPRFRELPVVLVTALETTADKARGLEVGADAYLPKGAFDQRQLLDTIAQLL
jgi:two-component system chemotaxis sensor kinase CheA